MVRLGPELVSRSQSSAQGLDALAHAAQAVAFDISSRRSRRLAISKRQVPLTGASRSRQLRAPA